MGLDVYLYRAGEGKRESDEDCDCGGSIEKPSAVDPEHLFKVGYLRSSYNDSGMNSTFRKLGLPGLYEIFEPGERYCFAPDWAGCLTRCDQAIQAMEAVDPWLRSFSVSGVHGPVTEERAIELVREAYANRRPSDFSCYSNGHGTFALGGIQIVAAIPTRPMFGSACTLLVMKDDEGKQWFRKALQITREMIAMVLESPDRDKYRLHWSA